MQPDEPALLQNFISFRDKAYKLSGTFPIRSAPAPDFHVHGYEDGERTTYSLEQLLSDGQPILISSMTSIDTPLSALLTLSLEHDLRQLALTVSEHFTAITITSDLPFTLNRFAREHNIQNITLVSDYFDNKFGKQYGVLMEQSRLLARSLLVIDAHGTLQHFESPVEYEDLPDLEPALDALATALQSQDTDSK